MIKRLHLFVGLPRSGKSTLAKLLGYPRVEGDALREVIHGTPYKLNMEPLVNSFRHIMVEALFAAGHTDVIVDGCHQTRRQRDAWKSDDWICIYHLLPTSTDVCKKRAVATNQEYLFPVIDEMAGTWEGLTEEEELNRFRGDGYDARNTTR